MSNPVVQKICEEYDLLEQKRAPLGLVIKKIAHFLIHYICNFPVYLIEHFPLEHIFLGHLKLIQRAPEVNLDFVVNLLKDFDCEENENRPSLKRIVDNKYLADMLIAEKEDYIFMRNDLPGFRLMLLCVLGFVLTYISFKVATGYDNVRFLDYEFKEVISVGRRIIWLGALVLLMIYSGLKIPKLYNALIVRAYSLKLFDNVQDNVGVLKEVEYVKKSNLKLGSYKASILGIALGSVCVMTISFIQSSTVNSYTILLFIGIVCIVLPIMLIYPMIVTYFPVYESMKKILPVISFTHGDFCGGLHDYLKMQRYVWIYNELFIAIVVTTLNLFSVPWWGYCIFGLLLIKRANHAGWAFGMSLRCMCRFYKKKRVLISELRKTDNPDTIDQIENVKKITLFRLPIIVKTILGAFIGPLCISLLANNISDVTQLFEQFQYYLKQCIRFISF